MMDNNILKTPVYTENNICRETAEVPIDIDFNLPDYCPPIARIFKCIVTPRIVSKNVSGSSVSTDGTFTVNIIYCDADGRICGYEYQTAFQKTFEIQNDGKEFYIWANIKNEYINCRAVTERRIDVHGAACITVCAYERQLCEVITDYDDPDSQLKRETVNATTPMGFAEKYLLLEEEIEIGQAQPAVRTLLRYDTSVMIRECKLINEKAIIKGEMLLTVIYNTDSEKMQTVRSTLPFSQLIEMEGTNEHCTCDADVKLSAIEVKPRTGLSGEIRSFSVSAKLLVTASAFCECEVDTVLDAYSRKCELNIAKKDINFKKVCKTLSEVCQSKSEIAFGDITLSAVSDIWCDIQNSSAKFSDDKLLAEGKVNACIIVLDENGKPNFYERTIDFSGAFTVGEIEGAYCEPKIEIKSVSYTLLGNDKLELRVEIGVFACVYSVKTVPVIVSVEKGEIRPFSADRGAMTIYFAEAGEHIWDIARRYRSSVDEICQINEISSNILPSSKMILVPMI